MRYAFLFIFMLTACAPEPPVLPLREIIIQRDGAANHEFPFEMDLVFSATDSLHQDIHQLNALAWTDRQDIIRRDSNRHRVRRLQLDSVLYQRISVSPPAGFSAGAVLFITYLNTDTNRFDIGRYQWVQFELGRDRVKLVSFGR